MFLCCGLVYVLVMVLVGCLCVVRDGMMVVVISEFCCGCGVWGDVDVGVDVGVGGSGEVVWGGGDSCDSSIVVRAVMVMMVVLLMVRSCECFMDDGVVVMGEVV